MLHVAGEFYLQKPTVQITFLLVFNVVVWWSNQHCYLERKFKEYLPGDFFTAFWLEINNFVDFFNKNVHYAFMGNHFLRK